VASDIIRQIKTGKFRFEEEEKKPEPLFKVYADTWINNTVPATCKESTAHDYERILENHVLPVFGDMKLGQITEGVIKDFLYTKVNEGKASSTINHFKNVISGVLNKAVDDKVILTNPAINLGRRYMKSIEESIEARKVSNEDEENGELDPLTTEELKLLLDKVQEKYPAHYPLFLLLARTGMRAGEALGLKWGDIDFNSRFIHLKRSLSRGRLSTLKGKRDRKVDMSLQLADTLTAHRQKCKAKGFELGLGAEPEYVFTDKKGGFMDINNWRRRTFNKALEKAELRKIRIHDIRHSYC
jgi:integrase